MLPHDPSLEDIWQEWFHGVNGKPSILQLNKWFSTSWRRGSTKAISNANAAMYLFKKNIVHAILQSFPPGSDELLVEREAAALISAKKRIERAGSINMFERSLPKKAPKRKPMGTTSQSSAPQPTA
ncbi:hypothetical protein EDD21DRAFT_417800 [Dissophora ornata]|nr:hypothetical protein EDD21DRAFT_417800 [Dissophora ornata]